MSAKRFNPCNVNGPRSDGHVARLHPGQDLHVMLDEPSVCGHSGDCEWEIVTKSEFITFAGSEVRRGRKLYRFSQVGNLSHWANLGTTFLGNVMIYAKSPDMTMESHASLCVFLNSRNVDKMNHVVVVNPTEDHCVKLGAHETLEVVFPDSKDSSIEWRHYQHPVHGPEKGHFKLEFLRDEVLPKDQPNNRRQVSELFYAEHRSIPATMHQRHYWFAFNEAARNAAASSEITETIPATRLFFVGKDPTGRLVVEYSIQVNLAIKDAAPAKLVAPKIHLAMPDEHYVNANTRILCNPYTEEHISFESPDADWTIELENPFVGEKNCGWEAAITEVALPHCQTKIRRLKVETALTTMVSGRQFQRFSIKPMNTSTAVEDRTFLGVVTFRCKGTKLIPADRSVFCFFRAESPKKIAEHTVSRGLTPPYSSKSSSSLVQRKQFVTQGDLDRSTKQSYGASSSIYTRDYSSKGYQTVPGYSDVDIQDHQIGESILAGEKSFTFGKMMPPKDDLKKNGRNNPTGIQPLALLPNNGGNDKRASASEERTATEVAVADRGSKEKILFDPPSLTQFSIVGPRSRTIRLPIVEMALWEVEADAHSKVVVTTDNCVYSDGVVQHQSFNVAIASGAKIKPGEKTIAVLQAVAKRGCHIAHKRIFIVTAVAAPKKKTEDLPLGYVKPKPDAADVDHAQVAIEAANRQVSITRQAVERTHGLPIMANVSALIENRITVLDPLGTEPRQVELAVGDELEIVLHAPHKTHGQKGFRIESMMYSGSVECSDNSIWPLWNNQRVQRLLFRFKSVDKVAGRIFIFSGSTRAGQVEIKPKEPKSCPLHRQDLGIVQWGGQGTDGGIRTMLLRWEDNQVLRTRATGHMNIALERPSELMLPGLDTGSWHVDIEQQPLAPEVARLVPTIDRNRPWSLDEGFLTPGAEPWSSVVYTMRPLFDQQPALVPLIQACQRVYGNLESFPIGDIVFKYTVPKKFTICKTLRLELLNAVYYDQLFNEDIVMDDLTVNKRFFTVGNSNVTGLINPENNSTVVLDHAGDCLIVKLKIDRAIEEGQQTVHYWNLQELPAWLTFVGEEADRDDHRLFFFHLDHVAPSGKTVSGRIVFWLGNGIAQKQIRVRACF